MFVLLLLLLSFLVGFGVHRGGVCLVAATHELMFQRRADILLFIAKAVTVAFVVVVLAAVLTPGSVHFSASFELGMIFVMAAMLYGMGAAMNGGCALGTINRLMSGDLNFLATIIGVAAGFALQHMARPLLEMAGMGKLPANTETSSDPVDLDMMSMEVPLLSLTVAAAVLTLFWLARFLFTGRETITAKVKTAFGATISRGFLTVALVGVCSGGLYLLLGHSWDYSSWLLRLGRLANRIPLQADEFFHVSVTSFGLLAGILTAAFVAGGFRLLMPAATLIFLKFCGGLMMGFAGGFLQGGNDTLLLYGVPSVALHAPVAILLIMIMVGVMLLVQKRLSG